MTVRERRSRIPSDTWLRALSLIAVAVGVSLVALILWRLAQYSLLDIGLSPADLRNFVASWQMWAPIVSVMLMVAYSVLPLPAGAIALANGMLFGPLVGTTVTWVGAMAGAVLAYGFARWLGKPAVERLVPAGYRSRFARWTRCVGVGELLVVRLIPVISFTLINYSAGLAGVGLWNFVWTTALGILPLTIVSVLIGHGALAWSPGVWLGAALGAVATWLVVRRIAGRLSWRLVSDG